VSTMVVKTCSSLKSKSLNFRMVIVSLFLLLCLLFFPYLNGIWKEILRMGSRGDEEKSDSCLWREIGIILGWVTGSGLKKDN
ncbi:hypothetical protein ACOV11_24290, partial [Vibrio natriegens]